MIRLLLSILLLLLLQGCQESQNADKSSAVYAKEFYGTWQIVGPEGTDTFFDSDILLTKNQVYYQTDYGWKPYTEDTITAVNRVSEEIIEVKRKQRSSFYAIRDGVQNASISGKIAILQQGNLLRSYSTAGSVEISINHHLGEETYTTTNDDNGSFEIDDIASGEYEITINGTSEPITTDITIDEPQNDIGIFTDVGDRVEYNFKSELILEDDFIYGDTKRHNGVIRVSNIATQTVKGLSFSSTVNEQSSKINNFEFSNKLGTLEPGSSVDLKISFLPDSLTQEQDHIIFNITIEDVNQNIWKDKVSRVIYQKPLTIYSKNLPVGGALKVSSLGTYDFSYYNVHQVPYLSDAQYTIFLHVDTIAAETAYSIGLEEDNLSLNDFTDTSAYEPNDSLKDATEISIGKPIHAYLHIGDIDVYRLNLQ